MSKMFECSLGEIHLTDKIDETHQDAMYVGREYLATDKAYYLHRLTLEDDYHTVSREQRAGKLMHSARAPRVLLRGVSSEPCAEQHSRVLQNHPKTLFYSHNHRHQVTVGTRRPYALPAWCMLRGVWV